MKKITKPDEFNGKKFWLKQPDGIYRQTAFGKSGQRQHNLRIFMKQDNQFYWIRDDSAARQKFMVPVWPFLSNRHGKLYGEWSLLEEGDEGWVPR